MPFDLATLAQLSPQYAAYLGGGLGQQQVQENQLQQQKTLEDILNQQQTRSANDAKLPFELDKLRLGNEQTDVTTQNLRKTGQKQDLENQITTQTMPSTIKATNSENEGKAAKADFDKGQLAQQALVQVTPLIASTPEPLRAQVLREHLTNSGMNPDSPIFQDIFKMQPGQMPAALQKLTSAVSEQLLQMSPQAQATMRAEHERAQAGIKEAGIRAGGEVSAARIHAGATVEAARLRAEAVSKKSQEVAVDANNLLQAVFSKHLSPDQAVSMAAAGKTMAEFKLQSAQATGDEEGAADAAKQMKIYDALGAKLEQYRKGVASAANEGKPTITPGGGIGTRNSVNAFGEGAKKPSGTGTKDDPIKLD